MPILDLQQRIRELGRIRIGDTQPTKSGKTRPSKLSKFRITSASRPLLERVAQLYGGEVRDWTPQNSTLQQFEVYTESTRLPVLVPPQPVTQWYETWSGGGCQRRCDGRREVLKDIECPCGPDPEQRMCKPTTRVNVMLREVEGVGVWRLETHGYHAAVELPQAAEFLARAGGYIEGFLTLEERRVVRDGETRQFMVPALDIGITAGQLLGSSGGATGQLGPAAPAAVDVPPQRAALPAGPPAQDTEPADAPATSSGKPLLTTDQEQTLLAQIGDISDVDTLRENWRSIVGHFHVEKGMPVLDALEAKARDLAPPNDQASAQQGPADDDVWPQVMVAVPEEWSTSQVEDDFAAFAGVPAEQGTGQQMRDYIAALPERVKASA